MPADRAGQGNFGRASFVRLEPCQWLARVKGRRGRGLAGDAQRYRKPLAGTAETPADVQAALMTLSLGLGSISRNTMGRTIEAG